jgi:hypothetical protein
VEKKKSHDKSRDGGERRWWRFIIIVEIMCFEHGECWMQFGTW